MIIVGYILVIIGSVLCLVGEVMLLVVSFRKGLGWFFGCMLIPPLWLVFLAYYFREAMKPLAIAIVGIALALLGAKMAGCNC